MVQKALNDFPPLMVQILKGKLKETKELKELEKKKGENKNILNGNLTPGLPL
jgi:hypothetical protein